MVDASQLGTTDEQLRGVIDDVVKGYSDGLRQDMQDEFNSISAQVGANNDEVVTLAAETAAKTANEQTSGVVQLDSEQWSVIQQHIQLQNDGLALQNALMVFTLMLCAGLVGMRVFTEFARGFRRD